MHVFGPTHHTMSSARFRKYVRPAHDRTWDLAEANLLSLEYERQRIDELKTELSRNGFERPVVLDYLHWWSVRPVVCDGMHRSIAAMELGIEIPVRIGYDEDAEYDHADIYTVTAAGDDCEDLLDNALALSSFRLSAGQWIQCDVASGHVNGPVRMYLPRHPDLRQTISAELQGRLADAGITAKVEFLEEDRDDE